MLNHADPIGKTYVGIDIHIRCRNMASVPSGTLSMKAKTCPSSVWMIVSGLVRSGVPGEAMVRQALFAGPRQLDGVGCEARLLVASGLVRRLDSCVGSIQPYMPSVRALSRIGR